MIHAAYLSLLLLTVVPNDSNPQGMPDVDRAKPKPAQGVTAKAIVGPRTALIHAVDPANAAGGGTIVITGGGSIRFNGASSQSASSGPPGPPTLHWKNGETLSGEMVAASPAALTWKNPFFEDPLQLDWQVLDRIDWTQSPAKSADPFVIALRDGSFLYGDLASVGDDSISIHSTHHGDTVLKRSEVLSARRVRHGSNLLFSGPTGNVGWKSMTLQQDGSVVGNQFMQEVTPTLVTGPGGELQIRTWNRCACLDIGLPDSVDVEFRVHSSMRPEFTLALGGTPRTTVRIETWDDELVLAAGDDFKAIRKIEDNERDIALRVCWDKKTEKCVVFSATGDLIAEWQAPNNISGTVGLVLQNKGLDLSLDLLRIRQWNGKPPARFDQKQPHVEFADGRIIGGGIVAGPAGSIQLKTPGQAAATQFTLADVDALVFSSDSPQIAAHETTLSYADGTIVLGKLTSIADGHALVATSFTKEPLLAKLDGLHQLLIGSATSAVPASPLENQDKIRIQETTLHGKFTAAGDNWPRWTPIGGLKSSRLSKTLASEITRVCPADTGPRDPALFYLSSGDVLSGNLRSLDRSGAEFESPLMETKKLPVGQLDAIQFAAASRINVQGFADPGWQIVKGDEKDVRRENDTVKMEAGTAMAYPSLMQSSDIRFKYSSSSFSSARLRMFCAGTDSSHSINLLLGNTGNQFLAGQEATEGQFENQAQIKTAPGNAVAVHLSIGNNSIELFLNDVSVMHIPFDPSKCAGSGFIVEPASLWGNGVFAVSLSAFSAVSVPGRTWLPEIAGDIRKQVLTVPRFQKDDPPPHLLLAANGDVLRGEVEAATDSHFGFRSGLETLSIPRDRVKAVIWLKPPLKNSAAATPGEEAPPNPLDRMIAQRTTFGGVGLRSLISFLNRQADNLRIQAPDGFDERRVRMQFGGQTIRQEIEKICSIFEMRYRQDKDGTVILEPLGQASAAFPRKSYWLKPGAISAAASSSAQEFLAAKGIAFPDGASMDWQEESGLLSMTNTPENQDKLAAVLASEFGGNLGSPTHWLLLTSGARLALAVDKFEPDFITGRNPAYGVCKVPMSQVYIIRNSPPDPTSTIKMLEGWRLVSAPEPVIPGAGGEISPLLGKDAAGFKLPLLAGGDFDLESQKGHVVILDFWATWCGPCIKSLPGLIEAMASFPPDRVKLVGVNQGESPEQIKRFLEARNLKFTVAMDADQSVGQKYGVDAIPRTVIVGPDGKVAWMQTGYDPDGEAEAADVVKKLLDPPAPAKSP
jgi:peroxiredoxin